MRSGSGGSRRASCARRPRLSCATGQRRSARGSGAAGAPLAAGGRRLILRAVITLLAILLAALSAVLLFAAYDAGALERRWRPAALYLLVGLALAAASCSLVAGG